MSVVPVSFRLAVEGSHSEILRAVMAVDPAPREPGSMTDQYVASIDRIDPDEDYSDDVRGWIPLPNMRVLLDLFDAFDPPSPDRMSIEVVISHDGAEVWATLDWQAKPGSGDRTHATMHLNREALVGAVMGHVKDAHAALKRAMGRD